jgi:SUN domain-containing protein 1/2
MNRHFLFSRFQGNFTYDSRGNPVQTFHLNRTPDQPFSLVELKVLSNYGNIVYTCIYRFRIHGHLSPKS